MGVRGGDVPIEIPHYAKKSMHHGSLSMLWLWYHRINI